MSDIAVVRTLGGVYVVTPEHWGKVTSLRPSEVPVSYGLQTLPEQVHVLEGIDFRSPDLPRFHAAGVDDLSPGIHPLHFAGKSFSDWTRTSSVVAVYTGVRVDEVRAGAEHIVLESHRATWADRSARLTRSWLPDGHDGRERAVADGSVDSCVDAYIVRVVESKIPGDGLDLLATRFPGWAGASRRLTSRLARVGVRVRAVMHDPHFGYRPEVLLSDAPPPESPAHAELEALLEDFVRDTATHCQRCGADDPSQVNLPSPYLFESHLYCSSCRAFAIADRVDAATPRGGVTTLTEPGEAVTVWRTATDLHLITEWGHLRVASFRDRTHAMPPYPMPRALEHFSQVFRWRAFPNPRDGRHDSTFVPHTSEVLPGMTVGLASGQDEFTFLTPLDVHHGVACTVEDIDDLGDFLIWVAPGTSRQSEQVWLLQHGVATQLIELGWDLRPNPYFKVTNHIPEHRGEIGVVRIEQSLVGDSGGREAFDRYAPGWIRHLGILAIALHEIPRNTVELVHAAVDPLSGLPVVRLTGVPPRWGRPDVDLRGVWRSFLTECLNRCSICGNGGRLVELPRKPGRGRIHKYLCPHHHEQEDPVWNA